MIEMLPEGEVNASVIWLHGLGADGNDFVPIVEALELPADHGIRFLFPHAPIRPVTWNGGMRMRAWFDIIDIGVGMVEDESGIRESQSRVMQLIENEISAGIPAERVLLAGFSQGGCMALHTGLRFGHGLAGILGLSCYLPLRDQLVDELQSCQRDTPVCMMHGVHDPVVDVGLGLASSRRLVDLGLKLAWLEYPMEHTVCQQQLADIRVFLVDCLAIQSAGVDQI